MTVIEIEEQKQQQPTPTISTLEQKIDELAYIILGLEKFYKARTKMITKKIREIEQLASDLNVDRIQIRNMMTRSFINMGVSQSWLRKVLPESLKFTKHTRKDYLEREQQRDQESLIQPQEQHQELVELPESRQPELEQQQPSDGKAREVTTFDNKLAEMPQEEEEEKLKQTIKQLQTENEYLREVNATQAQQQQQLEQHQQQKQEEETFTAVGQLNLGKYYLQIRVTVNVKTKSVDFMDVDWQLAAE
jgi:hypothetical protein